METREAVLQRPRPTVVLITDERVGGIPAHFCPRIMVFRIHQVLMFRGVALRARFVVKARRRTVRSGGLRKVFSLHRMARPAVNVLVRSAGVKLADGGMA